MAYVFEEACGCVLLAGMFGVFIFTASCFVLIGRQVVRLGLNQISCRLLSPQRAQRSSVPVHEESTIRYDTRM